MDCCAWSEELDRLYDEATARADLDEYRAHGPRANTRRLVDELRRAGVAGATLLDVGGGVGLVQHELMAAGATRILAVDASRSYLSAAQEEARRRGYADRADYVHGDFVDLARGIESADVVTMDRVICCYPDMPGLVGAAADKARRLVGLVYPRDAWWVKVAVAAKDAWRRATHEVDRAWVHAARDIERELSRRGFARRFRSRRLYWQIEVYERRAA